MNIDIGFLMKHHGEPYEVMRGPDAFETMGLKNKENDGTPYVGFYPGTDVRTGDRLKGRVSGNEYQVHRTENTLVMGKVYQLKAYTRAPADLPNVSHVHVGSMVNSAIQQGSPGAVQTVTITQQNREAIGEVMDAIVSSFDKLGLSSTEAEELAAEIETIKAQLRTSKPKPGVVSACLESIKSELTKVAVRTAGMAAAAIASGLVERVTILIKGQ